jgi:ABC-type branched-subunit amino acid transport system ATPase component
MTPVLEATDVTVAFGGLVALLNVNLAVAPREVVAVVGPNGAGKTTLLNAISGLVPRSGSIRFRGEAVRRGDARAMARLGMARAFQHPQLIETESAIANAAGGAHLRSGYGPADQIARWLKVQRREEALAKQARDMLNHAEISDDDLSRSVSALPHGARKRIDIVRALMREPILLVLDEPTSGMGEAERRAVQELLTWIRSNHDLAILLVEHHMDVVRAVADRVVALDAGSVLMDGPASDVLDSKEFQTASLGKTKASPEATDQRMEARAAQPNAHRRLLPGL